MCLPGSVFRPASDSMPLTMIRTTLTTGDSTTVRMRIGRATRLATFSGAEMA